MIAAIVAAMAIAITAAAGSFPRLIEADDSTNKMIAIGLPLVLSGLGLGVSIICIFIARAMKHMNPATVLRGSLIFPPILLA